jgi:uncharacterized protein (TIGR02246 family)
MTVQRPEEIHQAFMAAFNAGDAAALLALYEPDASLAPAPGQVVTGRAAIGEVLAGFLALKGRMSIETVRVIESGDVALLHGAWILSGTGPDGSAIEMAGRNAEVLRRQADGSWLFVVDNPFGDA